MDEQMEALALRIAREVDAEFIACEEEAAGNESPNYAWDDEWLKEFAARFLKAVRGELVGYFQGGDGQYEQVQELFKDDPDVFLLYLHPAASQGEPMAIIERVVRRGTAEYDTYINSRFEPGASSTFMFDGHRWRYKWSSFDDAGEFDVLERPAPLQASTPLTDALSTEKHIGRKVFQDTCIWKLSRNLERKLAAAQAQIKLATNFIVNFSGNSLGGGDQPVQFLCSSYALVVNQNKALKAQIEEFERTLAAPAALGGKGVE